jgi:hypothetical protein
MNPNQRKVVRVEDDGTGKAGVMLECGHWQKLPTGIVCDVSNATFRAFMYGERFVSCKTCAKKNRENKSHQ